jgi:hypothetical protein
MFNRFKRYHAKRRLFLSLVFVFWLTGTKAQIISLDTIITQAIFYLGDTISCSTMSAVRVDCQLTDAQKKALAQYNRLRNAVYLTYPYARQAGVILNDINDHLTSIQERKKQKNYIHSREKDLRRDFTNPLVNMSVYQGKVLMKLINRETGNNCYEIIKEYKGGLTARFYQTVAFFFSSSLKQPYDPVDEDRVVEQIVKDVQRLYGFPEIARKNIRSATAGF